VKTHEEQVRTVPETGHKSDEAIDVDIEHRTLSQEAIGRLAYFYWEERGCQNDSPDEDWFRAESELRDRLAAAASND
jgi:hypothetical protein